MALIEKQPGVLKKREQHALELRSDDHAEAGANPCDQRALREQLTVFNRYSEPGKNAPGFHPTGGYSSPTPVTETIAATRGSICACVASSETAGMRRLGLLSMSAMYARPRESFNWIV